MSKRLRQVILFAGLGAIFLFLIFIINQTVQVIHLAGTLHPLLGTVLKYLILAIYALLIILSFYHMGNLPKALKWPDTGDAPNYRAFLLEIRKRLLTNKNLENLTENEALSALRAMNAKENSEADTTILSNNLRELEKELDGQANEEIKSTAKAIFIGTAVSQSGSLDSFVVLFNQVRMVWRVSRIYNQRPALRELITLYANVAGASFAARAIEELDFAEIIDPVLKSFAGGGILNLIPLISIVSNSIFNGATNALLTLRIGIITRSYCSLLSRYETSQSCTDDSELRKIFRTSAIREAGKLLGSVIVTPSQRIFKKVINSMKKSKDFSEKVVEDMGKATKDVMTKIVDFFKPKAKQSV
ncbi:MAG: YcjF family protein [bacterium]|nr:YcjF family protein [bacterium]